jgi:hypothetical protein
MSCGGLLPRNANGSLVSSHELDFSSHELDFVIVEAGLLVNGPQAALRRMF